MPSAEAPGEAKGYELAYQEAVRGLAAQNESLSGLRSRAGVIISAASIVAAFFGPTAPGEGALERFAGGGVPRRMSWALASHDLARRVGGSSTACH